MGIPLEYTIYLWGLVGVLLCWALVQYQAVVGYLLGACGLIVVLYLLGSAAFKLDRVDRDRILAALFLIALQPLVLALFEQAGSSLNTYTDKQVARTFPDMDVPAPVFQTITTI